MDRGPASPDEEAPRDPRNYLNQHHSYTREDFEGHRHHVYVGVNLPGGNRRRRRRHHHHGTDGKGKNEDRPVTPPSQRVQFILGEDNEDDGTHISHPLFSELETLTELEDGEMQWKETARWVKFEEDVEEGGERWSKPHVATLSLHSLFEVRSFLLNGPVLLDMDATTLEQIVDLLLDNMVNTRALPNNLRENVRNALLRKHRHQYEKKKDKENGGSNMSRLPLIRSLAEIGRNHSTSKSMSGIFKLGSTASFAGGNTVGGVNTQPDASMENSPSQHSITRNTSSGQLEPSAAGPEDKLSKGNMHFMRKLPSDAEASNILVGELKELEKPVVGFIRLTNSVYLGNLTEVPVPTRFLFVVLGPQGGIGRYHEAGRAMATLLSDEVFHDVAYRARNRNHLLAGIDEFLDAVTVLPPGEWDPAIRIEPPAAIPSQDSRKKPDKVEEKIDEEEEEIKMRKEAGLTRSGKLFGGLIADVKRKTPWYWSDFKDAFAVQTIASFFFLYFACLTPIITFGGLLGEATDNYIAAMESLVAGLICGVIYGFFSGQPLTILGSTGPVLVFETILYDFCYKNEWDYLSFRMWIGLWGGLILLILVAVDASALVCYITRFTEENFATLIALIFIYKAIEKVLKIGSKYPMEMQVDMNKTCECIPQNDSYYDAQNEALWANSTHWEHISEEDCHSMYNGTMVGDACAHHYADIFLLSVMLCAVTFIISTTLKDFKSALFFPAKIRQFVSDFAVIIAILLMTLTDYLIGIHTPKLDVPAEFAPTRPDRGWLVPPFNGNPWWSAIVAVVPAMLACILLFMDQQITAVIVNRKEFKLKKGGGYHLDLFILAILLVVNSVMGLPWFVAATVLSINHVNSLKKESECAAPGEKPKFLGVRENRVTHILIFLVIGLSVVMTPILKKIPMPVLFGVFLYMGISALKGLQLFDRILILFMPVKYQPDYTFLRQVPLKRVHLFTMIQLACLASLWVIKSFSQTSILFPLMLVIMILIRKLLDYVFTQRELKILDDALPESHRKKKIDDEENNIKGAENPDEDAEAIMSIPLPNGNVMKVPVENLNLTEELSKSGVWKDINQEKEKSEPRSSFSDDGAKKRRRRKKSREHRRDRESNGQVNGHSNGNVELNKVNKLDTSDTEVSSCNEHSL